MTIKTHNDFKAFLDKNPKVKTWIIAAYQDDQQYGFDNAYTDFQKLRDQQPNNKASIHSEFFGMWFKIGCIMPFISGTIEGIEANSFTTAALHTGVQLALNLGGFFAMMHTYNAFIPNPEKRALEDLKTKANAYVNKNKVVSFAPKII